MPNLQCTSSRIQQRFQVWPLRSDLSVFTRSFEPLTHTSLNASMECSHSQRQKTQNPEALSSNNILRHRTQINSYEAPTKPLIVTASHAKTTTDFWLQTLPFTPSLPTTFCCPQLRCSARSYKHTFPLTDAHSFFYMPLSLRLGPLRFSSILGITLHHNCIQTSHNCSTKSLAQRRDSTTNQAAARTKQEPQKKLKIQNVVSVFLSSSSNRHLLPPKLPAVSSLASCTSSPCTVTIFTSPKS